ncbi:branched-chain amino acid aminotransferase [Tenacibaculum sp. MAR_2009_124]|uniref:branched-chain amino acid aminotransferase n=1 Tax=Tenacibaculum sp. MAR_2009_124 TaxID=1250059 RepID=UPI00089ACC79|nr:branched-chain amino acid aminotransferase [Tenacibaculum sp. MAR_2009_124]SED08329.1 branched-chain amino acid aminotransferase [Tenacibaculum sp. MAR_2009_124]
MDIKIQQVEASKIEGVDFSNLSFGQVFTDHMLVCSYTNGEWENPEIIPYGPMTFEPSARVFHYGQAVFEGMKAYKDDAGDIFLFRPDESIKRLNASSERLAMPALPEEIFHKGLKKLLHLDTEWIKEGFGNSLYIRPFVIATEPAISASPSNDYKFIIICSPAQSYYAGEVRVVVADKFSRAANGGVGYAKAAGNYASQFYPTSLVNKEGYQQIIWTDANTHEYMEEAGTMNIFFRIGDKLITAPTNDRILDGITRKSIIQLAIDNNIEVEVRNIQVSEVKEAAEKGELKELFGSGTAAVVNPIKGFKHKDFTYELPELESTYASFFKEKLMNIQYNKTEDVHGWRVKV